jgi:hypothetical protein
VGKIKGVQIKPIKKIKDIDKCFCGGNAEIKIDMGLFFLRCGDCGNTSMGAVEVDDVKEIWEAMIKMQEAWAKKK